jgi:hypothetical protein
VDRGCDLGVCSQIVARVPSTFRRESGLLLLRCLADELTQCELGAAAGHCEVDVDNLIVGV